MIGQTLGSYQVLEKLGAGGMGEVYRARDTQLGRDVALKVLSAAFAGDPDRMARFRREAQVLASLNHPNIAAIYGLEGPALVLELVEGPTLAERMAAGALPLEAALPLARQIADALEAAHEKGIIHRDLKPANIKVTPQGTAKVLDFGLAKALSDDPADGDPAQSPTLSLAATRAGVILGTAGYMSPEQARGGAADRRADVWAFGVVLYEMLTGRTTFGGPTVSDTLAAVLRSEPDWSALPPETPPAIRKLLRRCLEKDPRRRLRDIADARLEMDDALASPEPGLAPPPLPSRLRHPLVLSTAMILAAMAGALAMWVLRPPPADLPVRKLEIPLPQMGNAFGTPFALSPDGKRIAYVSQDRLWIRELDQFEPREVAGSAGAVRPFWSPNSSNVGFLAGGKLWRAAASAGSATTICTLPDRASDAGGGVWTSDDRILFTTGSSGLLAVSATGGDPKPFVELDSETVDFHQPSALPEGRGAVFAVHRKGASYDTLAVSDGRKYRVILRVDNRQLTNPVYSTTGHVLYHRRPDNPGIWALPFSLSKLEATGEPFLAFPNANFPTVSPDGTLAMVRQAAAWSVQLVWLDRNGQVQGKIGQEPQPLAPFPRLSPDGKRLAIGVIAPGQNDVWIYDLARGTRTRLTFTAGSENLPVWSPSGSRIAFMTGNSLQNFSIAWIAADGTGGPETLAKGWEPSFSPDGKVLLYATLKDAAYDLWYLPLSGERKPAPILESVSRKHYPQLSPDGQYLAYISDESGREEIYLTRFPMAEGKWQVSVNGGLWPRWSAKGDRLFYSEPDNSLWEVAVELRPAVRLGTPRKLFARPRSGVTVPNNWPDGFDVTGDGNRFVVVQATEQHGPATITVIQNWFAEFRNRERK